MIERLSSNTAKPKSSLGTSQAAGKVQCNICCQNDGKYKCPRCKIMYCSVKCFKSTKHNHTASAPDAQVSKGIKKQEINKNNRASKLISSNQLTEGLSKLSEASQQILSCNSNSTKVLEDGIEKDVNTEPSTSNSSAIEKKMAKEERQQKVSKMLSILTLPQLQIQLLILNAIINEKKTSSSSSFQNFADLSNEGNKSNMSIDNDDLQMKDVENDSDAPVSTNNMEKANNPLIFSGSVDDNPDARREIALKKLQSLREGGEHYNELVEEFCKLFEQLESK